MPAAPQSTCRLCGDTAILSHEECFNRTLYSCGTCDLVQVAAEQLPTAEVELERYRAHNNSLEDATYREYLLSFVEPLIPLIDNTAEGLDYGCGPGAPLTTLLAEREFSCAAFDPFFHADANVFSRRYDYITCCEVIEHFHNPANDFAILNQRLRPNGLLLVRTSLVTPETDFYSWPYVRDCTHVSFYSEKTLSWVARHFGWERLNPGSSALLFRQSSEASGNRE